MITNWNQIIHSSDWTIILVFSNRVINFKITTKESLVVKKKLLARNLLCASSNCNLQLVL